ncbi:MAG: Ig-like domain-containing protein [Candidatus Poribacteria bacterium]|nr:Ig-like domain-containing protein [Candidatus Poribacteria bacterium]
MPKIKNMYGVTYKPVHKSRNQHKHENDPSTKSPSRSIWVNFLAFSDACKLKLTIISQIFVCLAVLMVSANVWAAPILSLSAVDTNGEDSVFNGSAQKLRITIGLTGTDEDPQGPYIYTLTVNGASITGAPEHQIIINQTKTHDWDGGNLSDGVYTIRLEITEIQDPLFHLEAPFSTDVSVTLDKTAPEISIGTETAEFSPNGDRILDTLDVFYGTNEGLKESKLEFFLKTGESKTLFGQSVNLNTSDGGHLYVWDGGDSGAKVFPDGQYILKIRVVDKGGNTAERETIPVTIDTKAPLISQVAANENLTLVDGTFINVPIQLIKVTANAAGGTPLDFAANQTELTVKKRNGGTIGGDLSYDATALTLSFGNRLDTGTENGEYTASIVVADRAGNATKKTVNFTFDNVSPNLTEVATSNGKLAPGSGVNKWMNFVEATLSDNLQDGLSLSNSTIQLTGPNGAVLGQQTQPAANKIRWTFLSPLLAKDGLMDGEYTIEVLATDKAGNQTGTLQIPFLYDNLPPLVTLGFDEASPFPLNQDTIYHAQPLSQIVATFDDAGVGVDLDGDTRVVFGTTGADGQINALSGRKLLEKERNLLTYVLETPLANRDGSQDGRYVLNVQATDTLGNTKTYNYHFVYDTQLPTLVSTTPAANTTISELSQVEVVLDEKTSGIDFIQSTFQLTRDVNGNFVEVPVNITSNGTDKATLTLAEPIALDGSDDGTYTIEITPTDLAGNLGTTVRREFYLISQTQPEIRLTMPETTTVNNLTTVVAELSGYIGAGIDLDASALTVRNAQGSLITSTELEHDEVNNLLTWNIEAPLPRDGSADGEYTVIATFVDFTGRRLTQQFQLLLDTQFPLIESVQVATESQPELSTDTTTTLAEGFSQITVTFENTQEGAVSGIDFINTGIALTNPAGENIVVNRVDNGQSRLTLDFQTLTQLGEYVLSITPQDLAGNQSTAPFVYQLRIDVPLPTVSSVRISGKLGTIVYANGDATNIVATFADLSGAGLDLDDDGSTITVTTESGLPAPGITTSNGIDQLTWTPTVLPIDGSADGRYTVTVIPKDKLGRQGDAAYRQFVYDTQEPRITAATPVSLNQPATYIGSLTQLQFTVEDVGPAGLELAEQTIELLDPQGATVNATFTSDEINSHLYLTLDAPLAQDGSVDGTYTVKVSLVDKAGNISDSEQTFVYDSQVPQLTSISVNTEPSMELVPQEIIEISESISSITLQFEEATRVDFTNTVVDLVGPDNQAIPLNISVDGLTQLTARFVELTQTGLYSLSVTPQDIAGNVTQGALQYVFRLVLVLPSVSTVELGGQTGDVVFLNGSDSTIVATLVDATGTGLDLGEGGSSIVVTNPTGSVISSQTRANGTNQLIWQPISLPTDGSADGRYTVAITPIDKAGRQGDVVYREFIYDTESPRITASSPIALSQPVSYIPGGLNQFSFTVEDVGPADLLLEAQTIELIDSSGSNVPATLTYDELTNQLYLTLPSPFARDGSVDGAYTVKLSIIDRAGNTLDLEHLLIYDSQVPQLSSVMVNTESPVELLPQEVTEILEPVSRITLQFGEATRVDFENTAITLLNTDATDASGELTTVEIPLTLEDDGTSQMTLSFPELNQIGTYTLSVTPQDIVGNVATGAFNYTFILDIPLPSVSSVIIGDTETGTGGDIAYVNASNMIIGAELLDPTETGLSFRSDGSDITVTTPDGTVVPGTIGSNGENLLLWQPRTLTTDGTTDGRYRVYVFPVDKAGRQGNTAYREFIYDTQEPELTQAGPIDFTQPISYISQSLTQFHFTVADVGPAELELSDQKVSLRDASGNLVPAQLTNDTNSQLFLTLDQPLPLDGSMDGEYTVAVELTDKAGNAFTVEHQIVYDTQAPTLVNTVPADGSHLTEDITQIQVTLNDEGGSGIDWTTTTVTLVNPSGQQISGELVSNGTTALTLSTNQLVEDGRYIIQVRAVDRAGNGNATLFERNFLLSRRLPTIVSTEPVTAPADEAFTNEEIEQIEVELETDDENHLSTLRLLNPGDQVVAGQQQRASGKLIYNLVRPLATDGSEDGRYTIEFTPISASGRSGEVQRLTFTYDTQAPEIESDDVINLVVSQPGVNNSLTEIRVNLTDDTSGIDWENLDEEWLTFERLSPNATEISGRIDDDGQGNLTFRLAAPLADNGSADGEYRITLTPKDRAGNDDEPYEKVFIYDSSPPMIDTGTLLINDAPLLTDINADDYPTAVSTTGGVVIQANIFDTGLGVNLAQSKIIVRRPDGSEISGNTQQNGVDTIIFKSDGLSLQGSYQVTVMSVGNDSELLGFAPTDSITTEFLYEIDEPTAALTSDGGETELTDEPLPLEGTASDPAGTQRIGEGEIPVPASGVWLVEIVGTGPDDQPIDPVPAVDDSNAQEEPWSRWSLDFLPTRSGEYDLDVRVTDNAGNYAVYDIGKYTMSVSLTFRGSTFGWPNPLRLSQRDVAFFSFDVNVPLGETIELTLSIYDWSGDMVLSQTYPDVVSGQRNDQLVKWNLENQAGTPVARGLYIFRLEAVNAAGNRANTVGKVLVVD